jgi:hypothetical protein
MTKAPESITYASVVSRETVRIAVLMAALNDLNVKVGDVLNAYITPPITEYGQSLDQNLALTPVRVPSLCALYMD